MQAPSNAPQGNPLGKTADLWRIPEITLSVLSFSFHFVWEFLQVPAYDGMTDLRHWEGVKICTAATFGDVGLSLIAFWATAAIFRSRRWIQFPRPLQLVLFVAVGIVLTVGLEYYYVEVSERWSYSDLMPRVPPLGTGLAPLLQWMLVPILTAYLTGRIARA